jgi:hypothetical protein
MVMGRSLGWMTGDPHGHRIARRVLRVVGRREARGPGPEVSGWAVRHNQSSTTPQGIRTTVGRANELHTTGAPSSLSIARVIEPAVATNLEPPKRVHAARRSVASGQHLRGQDLGKQNRLIAVRAWSAAAEASAEDLAVWAALLAEEASLAGRACVHGVGDEGLPTPGLSRQLGEILRHAGRLSAPVGALLAGVGAVASAGRDGASLADRAGTTARGSGW